MAGCHCLIVSFALFLFRLYRLKRLYSLRLGRPLLHLLLLLTRLRRGRRRDRLGHRLRSLPRVHRFLHHQRRLRFHHPHAMAAREAGYLRGDPERPPGGGLDGWREGFGCPLLPVPQEISAPPGKPYLSARAAKWRIGSPQPQIAEWLRCTDSYQSCSIPGTLCLGGLQ